MRVNARGIELIKKWEGCVLKPYICPAGVLTIYYGHVIQPGETFKNTQEEANQVFLIDLQKKEHDVAELLHVSLTSNQFSAVVSLAYNIGMNAFKKSTMLVLLNQEKFSEAALQFCRWIFVNRSKMIGLKLRRKEEEELFGSLGEETSLFPEK